MRVYIKKDETTLNDSADISCFLNELDIVLPASATDIVCEDALDYNENREDTLNSIISKLRYNGRLLITGLDIEEFAREVLNRNIQPLDACMLPYNGRKSVSTINLMIDFLKAKGLDIINCRLQGIFYYILAVRNARN